MTKEITLSPKKVSWVALFHTTIDVFLLPLKFTKLKYKKIKLPAFFTLALDETKF